MKKIKQILFLSIFIALFSGGFVNLFLSSDSMQNKSAISSIKTNSIINFKNITTISDDHTYWNNDSSSYPSIATDNYGIIHVVWQDDTDGTWGTDTEIMYTSYSNSTGWSNATVISDDENYWNNGSSLSPSIAVDNSGIIHVVWYDTTEGIGDNPFDYEIMYTSYTESTGWLNATVISDDENHWNNEISAYPDIAIDLTGNIHVIWQDLTAGHWGTDFEIMYTSYSESTGWSNATVISDDLNDWNNDESREPSIAVDNNGKVHVVWIDETDGTWGIDDEIMYTSYSVSTGWLNATVISDDYTNWNNEASWRSDIAVDADGIVHVVWEDGTRGPWQDSSSGSEIFYKTYTEGSGWSNITVISDDKTKWNIGFNSYPSIAVDKNKIVHVAWIGQSNGEWVNNVDDREIMYVSKYSSGWSNVTVISDGYNSYYWNDDASSFPSVAVDENGVIHVAWQDETDGLWGTDKEIMYTSFSVVPPTSEGISLGYSLIFFMIIGIASLTIYTKKKL